MTAYVVQTGQNSSASSATVTVTLPAQTRAGNCLVVVATSNYTVTNATGATATLGGSNDNFTQIQQLLPGSSASIFWLADPSCAGGQTSVVVTFTGGTGVVTLNAVQVIEAGGVAAAAVFDAGKTGTGSAASWTSGTTGELSVFPELLVGAVATGSNTTITGPGWPWINLPEIGNQVLVGYQVTAAQGTAAFAGTFSGSVAYGAGVAALYGLPVATPSLPALVAGSGPQQGDMNTLWSSPAGFFQQRTIFRASQTGTTTALPPSSVAQPIAFDTILEDPYQGWSAGSKGWTVPYTGLYQITLTAQAGTAAANSVLVAYPGVAGNTVYEYAAVVLPTAGGAAQASAYVYAAAGQLLQGQAALFNGSGTVSTSGTIPSTMEITWVLGA